jgi:hypothetical protein
MKFSRIFTLMEGKEKSEGMGRIMKIGRANRRDWNGNKREREKTDKNRECYVRKGRLQAKFPTGINLFK